MHNLGLEFSFFLLFLWKDLWIYKGFIMDLITLHYKDRIAAIVSKALHTQEGVKGRDAFTHHSICSPYFSCS